MVSPLSRAAVVVPIKEGSCDHVRRLLMGGLPFTPKIHGLELHEVFLTDREVVLVCEVETEGALDRLASDLSQWATAAGWQEYVAGLPRLAESTYVSAQSAIESDLFAGPLPGPGDSDGGDLYSPDDS